MSFEYRVQCDPNYRELGPPTTIYCSHGMARLHLNQRNASCGIATLPHAHWIERREVTAWEAPK